MAMPNPQPASRKCHFHPLPLVLILGTSMLLGACQRTATEHEARFLVFGTQVNVIVRDVDEQRAEHAFAHLARDFQRMHREWHPWDPGPLSELNRDLAEGGWVRTTPQLITLIRASQDMEQRSDGHFNAAIGGLIGLWGFHTSSYPITSAPPSDQAIATWLATRPSSLDLEIDGQRVRSRNPAVSLDFGGIAKGLAARLACDRLAEFRMIDAMIDLGGDVMICGASERPWQVAISDGQGGVLTQVEVNQPLAIFTSGNQYRYLEWQQQRYPHILDPTTGMPVTQIMQVTVLSADPLLADAAATGLLVAGPNLWPSVARNMQADRVIVIDEAGRVEVSESLENLIGI
jgi:FAD:protein FMN transferase